MFLYHFVLNFYDVCFLLPMYSALAAKHRYLCYVKAGNGLLHSSSQPIAIYFIVDTVILIVELIDFD